jgi:hypothetical protein
MKTTLKTFSVASLAGTLVLACGFFADAVSLQRAQAGLLVCAVVWFATAPFWMEHKAAD